VLDLAHRAVAAVDPDAKRIVHVVALDHPHRHLGHGYPAQLRAANVILHEHHLHGVSDDAFAPPVMVQPFTMLSGRS
jgi:hypothetical protein